MKAIRENSPSTELALWLMLAIAIVGLEVISAQLAYQTLGAVASALYWMAIGINLLLCLIAFRSRLAAAIAIVFLGLVLIPYQFVLAERFWRVQVEAARIVAFAYETKISGSAYPTTLADYAFDDPTTMPFVQEYKRDDAAGGFILCYWVGTQSTSHCYSPQMGWTYVAD